MDNPHTVFGLKRIVNYTFVQKLELGYFPDKCDFLIFPSDLNYNTLYKSGIKTYSVLFETVISYVGPWGRFNLFDSFICWDICYPTYTPNLGRVVSYTVEL